MRENEQFSERKEDEARAKANELRDSFFANISHELRTPLSVIAGMAELIRSDPGQWVESGTELIKLNARDILDLVNQILDLQKLEKKELNLDLIQADVIPFLRKRAMMFEGLALQKGISFKVHTPVDSLVMDFDQKKMLRILSNMIGNAIKFTDEGEVQVMIDKAKKDGTEVLRLDIIDSGIGIKSENQDKIFARFYQADTMQSKVGQGTGIGLELVQEMLQLMDGDIELNSATGVGTHFKISIPVTNNATITEISDQEISKVHIPQSLQIKDSKARSQRFGPSLLIIEDNPDVVHMLSGQLGDEYEIHIADDGAMGVDMALELIPDVIISDIMMPYKDGYQVVDELKNNSLSSHIPILLLTGKDDSASMLKGLRRGADAYMGKPYDAEELKMRLTNFLAMRDRLVARFSDGSKLKERSSELDLAAEDGFISDIQHLLEINLDDSEYGIKEICTEMSISRTQLHNKLKALTGLSASRYIRKFRLAKGKELLRDSDLSISEIAYSIGFGQPSYFSNSFKAEYGVSPKDHRSSKDR